MDEGVVAGDDTVWDVGAFYELLTAHLESAYGRRHPRWIRGEISKVYEKTHLYVDLVDAGSSPGDARRPVLNAHCWASQWGPLKRRLAAEGVSLTPGVVVNVYGYVDLYAPQGRIGFTVTEVDVAGLLGDVARRRLELIARLGAEGLLEANRARPLSPVPLRVGLVASPQTEGYSDFTGQLLGSPWGFAVTLVATTVQGEAAPPQIVAALAALDGAGLDVICLVRGGGSRGDLACFDDERVARAIAGAATPVMTGIGHTGDESVADLVAHTAAITPTKLGEHLVSMVTEWRERHVRQVARRLRDGAEATLDEAAAYVGERRRTMIFAVRDRLRAEQRHLGATRARLGLHARHVVGDADAWLGARRRLLAAYDPQRRLAQGWSIVTRDGAVVRVRGDVAAGDGVSVRVSDGSFDATVTEGRGTP
ncbi:MAG: exodeoxyribonuclease VII large subunit [Acidimicrobiales bacterium]